MGMGWWDVDVTHEWRDDDADDEIYGVEDVTHDDGVDDYKYGVVSLFFIWTSRLYFDLNLIWITNEVF